MCMNTVQRKTTFWKCGMMGPQVHTSTEASKSQNSGNSKSVFFVGE